jgi:hypothetical protein
MSHVFEEIAEYSGVAGKIAGPPVKFDWGSLAKMLFDWLMKACPAKFANQKRYAEAYDAEFARLMKGKDHCPMVARPFFRKQGITGRAAQNEAYVRLFMSSNGYKLAELKEGLATDATAEV